MHYAYFTGSYKTYEKLQWALNAGVDKAAWAELYSTKSRTFNRPSTARIAVKVINHSGIGVKILKNLSDLFYKEHQ